MSDQADKLLALVNQLRWDQKKNSLTAEDVDTVENALLELQRLERSHTAPRELVEAVKVFLEEVESRGIACDHSICDGYFAREKGSKCHAACHCSCHDDPKRFVAIRSALTAHEPKACEWVKIETDETLEYIPSCHGAVVYMNNVAGFKFCPYCGRPIQVKDGGK